MAIFCLSPNLESVAHAHLSVAHLSDGFERDTLCMNDQAPQNELGRVPHSHKGKQLHCFSFLRLKTLWPGRSSRLPYMCLDSVNVRQPKRARREIRSAGWACQLAERAWVGHVWWGLVPVRSCGASGRAAVCRLRPPAHCASRSLPPLPPSSVVLKENPIYRSENR